MEEAEGKRTPTGSALCLIYVSESVQSDPGSLLDDEGDCEITSRVDFRDSRLESSNRFNFHRLSRLCPYMTAKYWDEKQWQ